jgi:DNA topoisomerase-1
MERLPQEDAAAVRLRYVSDDRPGLTRRACGKGFSYRDANGRAVRDKASLARVRALAIPPAWTEVWICPDADGHIQATGRDARGRKQYIYHPRFRDVRESAKFEHILAFAQALPRIRGRARRDLARKGLPREKVLAALVRLLETTLIRVGNEDYAKQNKSYGLTTLRARHARIAGDEVRLAFVGKSGKTWRIAIRDRRLAKIIRGLHDLPGQRLFQYEDDDGAPQSVTSTDVNAYLREISGSDISAKDFRTWAGTVLAATELAARGAAENEAASKRTIRDAIVTVAQRLGNTPTICRKCYVHPAVVESYLDRTLTAALAENTAGENGGLLAEEAAVFALLSRRIAGGKGRAARRSAPRRARGAAGRPSRRRRGA